MALDAMIRSEAGGNTAAYNKVSGAGGIIQFMPQTIIDLQAKNKSLPYVRAVPMKKDKATGKVIQPAVNEIVTKDLDVQILYVKAYLSGYPSLKKSCGFLAVHDCIFLPIASGYPASAYLEPLITMFYKEKKIKFSWRTFISSNPLSSAKACYFSAIQYKALKRRGFEAHLDAMQREVSRCIDIEGGTPIEWGSKYTGDLRSIEWILDHRWVGYPTSSPRLPPPVSPPADINAVKAYDNAESSPPHPSTSAREAKIVAPPKRRSAFDPSVGLALGKKWAGLV